MCACPLVYEDCDWTDGLGQLGFANYLNVDAKLQTSYANVEDKVIDSSRFDSSQFKS